jgi:hypothetical protein
MLHRCAGSFQKRGSRFDYRCGRFRVRQQVACLLTLLARVYAAAQTGGCLAGRSKCKPGWFVYCSRMHACPHLHTLCTRYSCFDLLRFLAVTDTAAT